MLDVNVRTLTSNRISPCEIRALQLTHHARPWARKGELSVCWCQEGHPATKIMPKTNQTMKSLKCGRGTARSIGWASPSAYHKKDIGEPGNPAGRNSLGDGGLTARLPGRTERALEPPPPTVSSSRDDPKQTDALRGCRSWVGLRLGTANVGTMTKRSDAVAEMVGRRKLDFCCLQETKWKGEMRRMMGSEEHRYKFFWKGCAAGTSGVGIMIAEKWVDKVVEVKNVSERLMMIRIAFGEKIINIVSAYAPHAGRSDVEKEEFWFCLTKLLSEIKNDEIIFVGGDMNGHVGIETDGFEGIHGGNGYGKRNKEGEMLLEFAAAMELVVCNTFFTKVDTKKITYSSGEEKA